MSSTNRGRKRNRHDNYPTPPWCVRRFLEARGMPDGKWLEPCAGNGAIIEAVMNENRNDIHWTAIELRRECEGNLGELVGYDNALIGDFRDVEFEPDSFAAAMTNPPFSLAMPVIEFCLPLAEVTVMFLRLNFLASAERCEFMQEYAPDVYVLPNRPSLTDGKKTDSIEYGWFVFDRRHTRRFGKIQVLNTTPLAERRRMW